MKKPKTVADIARNTKTITCLTVKRVGTAKRYKGDTNMRKVNDESWYWRHKKGLPKEQYPGRNGKVIVTRPATRPVPPKMQKTERVPYSKVTAKDRKNI